MGSRAAGGSKIDALQRANPTNKQISLATGCNLELADPLLKTNNVFFFLGKIPKPALPDPGDLAYAYGLRPHHCRVDAATRDKVNHAASLSELWQAV